jgi:cytochrome c peroxidase
MHDGSLRTLEEVIAFYDRGGHEHALRSPLIRPLGLSAEEKEALVAFLHSLTGDNIDALVLHARNQPVGELRREDPHWAHEDLGERRAGERRSR